MSVETSNEEQCLYFEMCEFMIKQSNGMPSANPLQFKYMALCQGYASHTLA